MESFDGSDLDGAQFTDTTLRGARFVRCDLTGVVLRGVDVAGADIDAPWLLDEHGALFVNGVDVVPFVDAELDRRFPGRELRYAGGPAELRAAWAAVERTWEATLSRVDAMPAGTADVAVDGEWSFAQTVRHLVMATDVWLRQAVQGVEQPYHPVGQPNAEFEADGLDPAVFSHPHPTYAEVLDARAGRVAMVREYLDAVTPEVLAEPRTNPWAPAGSEPAETVLSCLRTILREEWEHHRYAVRDLDTLVARG